ncbi:MAG: lytic transglycosylase domain-containing protein [Caulobacter sp.]|nr:lytic transglycosylase domain-containing protein [Caulobacter sp.]
MFLPFPEFLTLAAACAPTIPVATLAPLIQVESAFNPLAINVNGEPRVTVRARSRAEAAATARRLIAQGRSVDLGLGQINNANLAWLRLTVEEAFDPCRNLTAAARVLGDGYARAVRVEPDPQRALHTAFSIYNTGHPQRGFDNGYVAKITLAAGRVPAMTSPPVPGSAQPIVPAAPSPPPLPPPTWDVFGRAAADGFVLRVRAPGLTTPQPASLGDLP